MRIRRLNSDVLLSSYLQVDSLSELFVEWDDVLREAETRIAQLERDKAERESLGYE